MQYHKLRRSLFGAISQNRVTNFVTGSQSKTGRQPIRHTRFSGLVLGNLYGSSRPASGSAWDEQTKTRYQMPSVRVGLAQMPTTPARIVNELHPTGIIREVKVELHPDHVRYAIETFIDGKQWDVEVTNYGEVFRNSPD